MNQTPDPAELPSQYTPADVESRLYQRWLDVGAFTADAGSERPPYTIVIPPPNVTGSLHLGHAFQHTLMDALTRRRRMQSYEALWLPGMDHAGIATQTLVERQLAEEGKSRYDLGREAFVKRVWAWKEQYGGQILGQMRRLGDGVDWSRERFTMDEGLSSAVLTMFKRLYEDDLIYQAERIINWCPRCRTALSDIEVDHKDVDGELVSLRYGDGDDSVTVATTRAETMLGDTAVAVHPDDERYRHLVGKRVTLPLTGRTIPVVADPHVDPEFGSGAVKVTPAHDPNDFEIGRRHDLESVTIMDERGQITLPGPFEGLDRFEARPAVIAALREEGRLVEQRSHTHAVGHCSRCETVVEPRLSLQWFVRVGPLAKAAGDAVRDGRVQIHPKELEYRYFEWVDNMHDWCISRQLWWGHRIPVWYGPGGEVVCVGPDDEPPTGDGWTQDQDVLDTWFSSGLWPFSTLGWPDDTADLRKFYPTDVLLTGYDILFFWVARMMMLGIYAMSDAEDPADAVPFRTIALTGLIRDKFGKKMSKSRGNTVDPLEWMDSYGSDALRFTLARGANPGQDVPIGEEWVQGSRNFCNKLWNAARFALLNGADAAAPLPPADQRTAADRWILSRLHSTLAHVDELFEDLQFAKVVDTLFHFTWDEFCDWYLEIAKVQIDRGGPVAAGTQAVLGHVLDRLLRALHPVVPYVTEELWCALTGRETVVTADWPTGDATFADADAERRTATLIEVVTEIRRFRAEQRLRPSQRVPARLDLGDLPLHDGVDALRALARLDEPADDFTASATLQVATATVELDLRGAIDVESERARLTKDLAAAERTKAQSEDKLANANFVERAPAEVVAETRNRVTEADEDIARLTARLEALADIQ
ncbi:MAG: valine--tRNA ligase [Streptosporangiales bacterium]|nr:valine--tRNA ligase [Streptosporangiales bacterium]